MGKILILPTFISKYINQMKKEKILAIIQAAGGSKRLPNKNILELG